MSKSLIIYQNTKKIEDEVRNTALYALPFQPFVDAFLVTSFKVEPGIDEIRRCILSKNLDCYLKEQAFLLDNGIGQRGQSKQKKFEQIDDLEQFFGNYAELKARYAKLPLNEHTRAQINNYILSDKGQLIPQPATIEDIISRNTIYAANEAEKEVWERMCAIIADCEKLKIETGCDIFCYGQVLKKASTGETWIEPTTFKQQMQRFNNRDVHTSH